MRIGFLGKGGSGKTTATAAFVRWLEMKRFSVVAIDGDVNTHLQAALSLDGSAEPLGAHYDEIASYVRGSRTDLGDRPLLSTTPPSPASRFVRCTAEDPLLSRFVIARDSLSFLKVGGFEARDVGANCYHTKLHSLCVLLNHLRDTPNEYVVVDATAGVDTLSTALVAAYDMNVFVVEPTLKSLEVYKDFIRTDPQSAPRTVIVINKSSGQSDVDFVRRRIDAAPIIAVLPLSFDLRRFEQGESSAFDAFVSTLSESWESIRLAAIVRANPWGQFESRLHEIHRKNCEWWYNAYHGEELHTGLDRLSEPRV